MEKNWEDVIAPYMDYYDDYFCNDVDKNSHHLLFVEGRGDSDYYFNFFKVSKEKTNNKYDCTIKKRDILYDFTNKFHRVNEFGRFETDEEEDEIDYSYNNEELKEKANNLKSKINILKSKIDNIDFRSNENKYDNFSFVIKCMKEAKDKNYNYIDCFGIIDYDSGQHINEIETIDNIEQSKCHDRETTLLRCGLLNYINSVNEANKDQIKKKIKKTLLFTTKQGIMEKSSFEYSQKYGESKVLKKMTSDYIKDKASKKDFLSFSYPTYINRFLNADRPSDLDYMNDYNQIKNVFENDFLIKNINQVSKTDIAISLIDAETNLNNYLEKEIDIWLNSFNNENVVVDEVFIYTNGHIFLEQLLQGNDQTKLFIDESGNAIVKNNRGEEKLLNLMFDQNNENNINTFFNCAPLKKYNIYRQKLKKIKKKANLQSR